MTRNEGPLNKLDIGTTAGLLRTSTAYHPRIMMISDYDHFVRACSIDDSDGIMYPAHVVLHDVTQGQGNTRCRTSAVANPRNSPYPIWPSNGTCGYATTL